jgi:hypothetical protein
MFRLISAANVDDVDVLADSLERFAIIGGFCDTGPQALAKIVAEIAASRSILRLIRAMNVTFRQTGSERTANIRVWLQIIGFVFFEEEDG